MRIPILLYHWFEDERIGPSASPEFATRPQDFRAQVRWLVESGFQVIGLDRVVAALHGRTALPERPVVITFDDGYVDFHRHALPVLAEYRVPATLFVPSGHVGKSNDWDRGRGEPPRPVLDWPQLREVAQAGVEIGSHSISHPDLRTLPPERAFDECRGSRQTLEDGLGRKVRYFAYPHGLYDSRVKQAVREAGYEAGCAVLLKPWDLLRSDEFAMMRAIIHGTKSFANFRVRVRLAAPAHQTARSSP